MDENTSQIVTLREITKDTLRSILKLQVTPEQNQFVASNAVSVAQAHYEEKAWYRAIYADEEPVGFVMLYLNPEETEYFLWRFMIDARFQGKGYGYQAMQQVIEFVRSQPGATEMGLSYVPAEGGPGPFYRKLGFIDTDEWEDEERVMRLSL